MFSEIPQRILSQMDELERRDSRDRVDGTPRMERLRQIPPEVGKFIALLAVAAPAGRWIELGTSAAYSTLWLSLACRAVGKSVTTPFPRHSNTPTIHLPINPPTLRPRLALRDADASHDALVASAIKAVSARHTRWWF